MRARECESSLPVEYLRKLSKAYEDFLEDISQLIPVLRVNWSSFHTAEEMADQIRTQYAALRSIRRIDWDGADAAPAPRQITTPPKARFDQAGEKGGKPRSKDAEEEGAPAPLELAPTDVSTTSPVGLATQMNSISVGGESPQ